MGQNDNAMTEQRVIEIVEVEIARFQEIMATSVAKAIVANNEKIGEQLREWGVIK